MQEHLSKEQQYNEAFNALTEVEQRVVLEYLKGTRFEDLANTIHYRRDSLYKILKKAVNKLVYR